MQGAHLRARVPPPWPSPPDSHPWPTSSLLRPGAELPTPPADCCCHADPPPPTSGTSEYDLLLSPSPCCICRAFLGIRFNVLPLPRLLPTLGNKLPAHVPLGLLPSPGITLLPAAVPSGWTSPLQCPASVFPGRSGQDGLLGEDTGFWVVSGEAREEEVSHPRRKSPRLPTLTGCRGEKAESW